MKRLEPGRGDREGYREEAQELPDEAAFLRKVFERGNSRISVDCRKLEEYIETEVRDPDLKREMLGRLAFIMVEMDPSLRPQALIQFFQQYYVQFSGDANLQQMIDFILTYEAMEGFALILSNLR